ncbi:MAG: hypothetical protein P8Y71_10480, partial [Pseudolabrys sp.]
VTFAVMSILGGLHHQYIRIWFPESTWASSRFAAISPKEQRNSCRSLATRDFAEIATRQELVTCPSVQ